MVRPAWCPKSSRVGSNDEDVSPGPTGRSRSSSISNACSPLSPSAIAASTWPGSLLASAASYARRMDLATASALGPMDLAAADEGEVRADVRQRVISPEERGDIHVQHCQIG